MRHLQKVLSDSAWKLRTGYNDDASSCRQRGIVIGLYRRQDHRTTSLAGELAPKRLELMHELNLAKRFALDIPIPWGDQTRKMLQYLGEAYSPGGWSYEHHKDSIRWHDASIDSC
jgi:hypothetical protein